MIKYKTINPCKINPFLVIRVRSKMPFLQGEGNSGRNRHITKVLVHRYTSAPSYAHKGATVLHKSGISQFTGDRRILLSPRKMARPNGYLLGTAPRRSQHFLSVRLLSTGPGKSLCSRTSGPAVPTPLVFGPGMRVSTRRLGKFLQGNRGCDQCLASQVLCFRQPSLAILAFGLGLALLASAIQPVSVAAIW
jgi:hypothetical protein